MKYPMSPTSANSRPAMNTWELCQTRNHVLDQLVELPIQGSYLLGQRILVSGQARESLTSRTLFFALPGTPANLIEELP